MGIQYIYISVREREKEKEGYTKLLTAAFGSFILTRVSRMIARLILDECTRQR